MASVWVFSRVSPWMLSGLACHPDCRDFFLVPKPSLGSNKLHHIFHITIIPMKRLASTATFAATRRCRSHLQRLVQGLTHNGSPSLSQSSGLTSTDIVDPKIRIRSFSSLTPQGSTSVANTSKDGTVGLPIDFDVQSRIEGNESQIVTITLEPGQVLRAESGAMMYMTDGVEMNTTTG